MPMAKRQSKRGNSPIYHAHSIPRRNDVTGEIEYRRRGSGTGRYYCFICGRDFNWKPKVFNIFFPENVYCTTKCKSKSEKIRLTDKMITEIKKSLDWLLKNPVNVDSLIERYRWNKTA